MLPVIEKGHRHDPRLALMLTIPKEQFQIAPRGILTGV